MNMIIILLSLLFGSLGALVIKKNGFRLDLIDVPNHRSSHKKETPKGGGIGILIAFVVSSICLNISIAFWMPALVLSGISFLGDRFELSIKFRLIIQFVCSIIFLIDVLFATEVAIPGITLFIPLSIFIVGTANLYNFMDGIDGIAGITGVVGFTSIACFGYMSGVDTHYSIFALSIAFACAGFLVFNFPKAKVFMGDVGSVLLGFVLACLIIILSRTFLEFICLTGFFFPFYADELVTMFARLKSGDSLKKPHRKHIFQLLVNEYGIAHWKISISYGSIQSMIGLAIFLLKDFGCIYILLLLLFCFSAFSVFSFIIRTKLSI